MKLRKQIILIMLIFTIFSIIYSNISFATTTVANQDFEIASEAALLMETSTGKILLSKNEDEKLYPASTTKILTAIIAIEKYNLTDKLSASNSAVMAIPSGYSNAGIKQGETLTVDELLNLFLIHSANEVGYIFAENISGDITSFANLMNQKASALGCKNTHFTNPSGIHDVNHYSTAYDMALIAQYCMKNETFRSIVSKPSCTVEATDKSEKRYFKNTNDLLLKKEKYYYENAIGIKTGYTSQAKNCLIADAKKDNLELIAVTLGSKSQADRYSDTINMFEFGFNNYKLQQIATSKSTIQEITVKNATKETKNLSLLQKDTIIALTPSSIDLNNLDYSITLNENISAPIAEGEVLGKITYHIDGIDYTSDLISKNYVEEFNVPLTLAQIALALFILFVLTKLFTTKKTKRKKYKNRKKNSDSIYKFN